jgi:2-(1,2-epoxy-1,2-dihydrophenyl)acetyl-CoA isomerase
MSARTAAERRRLSMNERLYFMLLRGVFGSTSRSMPTNRRCGVDVEISRSGRVVVLRLNRPERNNALGGTIFRDLLLAAQDANKDDAVGAIVTSQVGPSWCVGGDINDLAAADGRSLPELWASPDLGGEKGIDPAPDPSKDELGVGRWVLEFISCRTPTIAAMRGQVAGGGLGLALLHDIRIASTDATFTAGFTRLGLSPEMGISASLPRAVGEAMASDMLLSNRTLTAAEALQAGLVSRVVELSGLEATALEVANAITDCPPAAIAQTRQLIRFSSMRSIDTVLKSEWVAQTERFADPAFRVAVAKLQAKLATRQRAAD